MSAVTVQEIVEALRSADRQYWDPDLFNLAQKIEAHGIAPSDNVKQADEETHRRVDEAVRNGRIEDRRAGGQAVSLSREEIIRMAQQCFTEGFFTHEVEEFAERISAAEREACVELIDEMHDSGKDVCLPLIKASRALRARGNGGWK